MGIVRSFWAGFKNGVADTRRNFWLLVGLGLSTGTAAKMIGVSPYALLLCLFAVYCAVRIAIRDEES